MAEVVYSQNALRNIERLFGFLAEHDPGAAADAVEAIRDGVDTLGAHPFIGRRVEGELRELVLSFGRTGYVALYRYLPSADQARILAIRHQRELDYPAREGEPPGLDR